MGPNVRGGLVKTGVLSLAPLTVTAIVAVPVWGGAASSTAITYKINIIKWKF